MDTQTKHLVDFDWPLLPIGPRHGDIPSTRRVCAVSTRGRNLEARLLFVPPREIPRELRTGPYMDIKLALGVPMQRREIARFSTTYKIFPIDPKYHNGDRSDHRYWDFHERNVNPHERRQGLGRLGFELMHEIMRGMSSHAFPAEWIQIDTQVSFVAKLALDFGYLPHRLDAHLVQQVLTAQITDADHFTKVRPVIRLMKSRDNRNE